jgi:hypothetical protein
LLSDTRCFLVVLLWTALLVQLVMHGVLSARDLDHQNPEAVLHAECAIWERSSDAASPVYPLSVCERAAYYLGTQWQHCTPNKQMSDTTNEVKSRPLFLPCLGDPNAEVVHLPICFMPKKLAGMAARPPHKGTKNMTQLDYVIFTHKDDLENIADRMRDLNKPGRALQIRFGDGWLADENLPFPVLVQAVLPEVARSSVLWPFHRKRYFGSLPAVLRYDITPFADKRNVAIWRGVTTGSPSGYGATKGNEPPGWPGRPIQRAALVRRLSENIERWSRSTSVLDVGVIKYVQGAKEKLIGAGFSPPKEAPFLDDKELWDAKMIIVAEGNDAATGLKWALSTTSAVLMPPPTVRTWLMEDKLEPWVHFIPVKQDFSDLEDKARWCLVNEYKCQAIGMAGRCFMRTFLDERQERAVEIAMLQCLTGSRINVSQVCAACD